MSDKTKDDLRGRRVAILATHGFEESELRIPLEELRDAGAEVKVVSPARGSIRGWKGGDWGGEIPVDLALEEADASDFEALVLPGGVINPDHLRMDPSAVSFVRGFLEADKPVAAICHGPWMLIEAGAVKGMRVTSWPSVRTDLENAGARWVDEEVALDGRLITSRKPEDLPAFCEAIRRTLAMVRPVSAR